MDNLRISFVLAAGLIVIGALVACNSGSRAGDAATSGASTVTAPQDAAPPTLQPASNLSPAIVTARPQTSATQEKPESNGKGTASKPAAVQSKPPTPTRAPAAASNSTKQGDDLEQQLDQLLNGIDHTDTVDDAGN